VKYIMFLLILSGCTQHTVEPEPMPTSLAMKQAIYQKIIDARPEGVIYKVYKEIQDNGRYKIIRIVKEAEE